MFFEDYTSQIRDFQNKVDEVLNATERKSLRIGVRADERSRIDEAVATRVLTSYNSVYAGRPMQPIQGKDSDGEIVFVFEDGKDAFELYDFMVENHLLEPGEIVLREIENQHSVAFMPHVLVMKPELIQAALIAYESIMGMDDENVEAFESMVERVNSVLNEKSGESRYSIMGVSKRQTPRAGLKAQPSSGNPFHSAADGKFTGASNIMKDKGGSHVHSMDGDGWSKFTGGGGTVKKGENKGKTMMRFGITNPVCGRRARCIDSEGNRMENCTPTYTRCWDGKTGGERVAAALSKKQAGEQFDIYDLSALMEVRARYRNNQ
jgi:hypothetical protein